MHGTRRNEPNIAGLGALGWGFLAVSALGAALPGAGFLQFVSLSLGCLILGRPLGRIAILLMTGLIGTGSVGIQGTELLGLGLLGAAAFVAAISPRQAEDAGTDFERPRWPLLAWVLVAIYSATFGAYVGLSNGVRVQDVASRLLLYCIPAVALVIVNRDAARSRSLELRKLGVVAIFVQSALWTLHWASIRGYMPNLYVPSVGTDSLPLAAVGLGLIAVRQALGVSLTLVAIVMSVLSGSRGLLVSFLILLLLWIVQSRHRWRAVAAFSLIGAAAVQLVTFCIGLLSAYGRAAIESRIAYSALSLANAFSGDESASERVYATRVLLESWGHNIWLGVGLGRYLSSRTSGIGANSAGSTLDSALLPLAELGAVGFCLLAVAQILTFANMAQRAQGLPGATAVNAFVLIELALTFTIGNPIEGRNFIPVMVAVILVLGSHSRIAIQPRSASMSALEVRPLNEAPPQPAHGRVRRFDVQRHTLQAAQGQSMNVTNRGRRK